jgi:large subunit ribosomal protein L41
MIANLLASFARTRRVPAKGWKVLTSKGRRNWYKGRGAMSTGVLTSWGKFMRVAAMQPHYVVPDLADFNLKPYVAKYEHESDGRTGTAAAAAAADKKV